MCVRYIGELTKLRAYVVYVMLFQVLTVTRDGNGSIVHTEERVVFGGSWSSITMKMKPCFVIRM